MDFRDKEEKAVAKQASAFAKSIGAGFKYDSEWQEYTVRYKGEKYQTSDPADALAQLQAMSRRSNGLFDSSPEDSAKELARDFHGRDNKGIKEYTLASYYPKDLAELGILIELQVFTDDAREAYVPINFAPEHPDLTDDETNVVLAANGNRKQLYLVGGDQEYDLSEFAETAGIDFPDDELEKDEVVLGEVKAIAYFADKHHLEGPKEQKTGIPYQHEFAINEETGEQIGEYPTLVYSQRDNVFKLVGGSYEILPEGISG